jgi:truncated hemoglobin YjbI
MSSTDLNGIPDKVQKTEQIFIWFIKSVWRGTWFRRLVFLLILFLTFASPTFITHALSLWVVQIPTWYSRCYWITAGLLVLLTLIAGLRTVPRFPGVAPPRIDVHAARGLVPFNLEDGDLFARLERGIMLQRVLAALTDPNFRFGILSGFSGTGKTSFLRAGLLAQLRKSNVATAYVELSNEDPLVSIQRELERQGQSTVKGVLLLDQFEQFFLHQRNEEQRKPLVDALLRWYQRDSGVRVLISIRAEDLLAMKEIQETVDYQLSNQNYFKLSNFSAEQAVKVLQVLCENAGINFDPAFATKIVHTQLQDRRDSSVSPVNLGILIHVLASTQNGHALTSETFKAYGGIDGILEDWLNSQLETARLQGLEKAVIRTLSSLCDFDHNRRSGMLTAEAIRTDFAGDLSGKEIDRALQWLERPDVRLVVRIYHGDAKSLSYQLTHERLIPAIRKTAGKLLGDAARANDLLDRRVREWITNERSSRFLLPLLEYWRVERQRPYLIWGDARSDKESLLKRSRRRCQRRAAYLGSAAVVLMSVYPIWNSKTIQQRVQQYYIKRDLVSLSTAHPTENAVRALALIGDWPMATRVADSLANNIRRNSALEEVATQMAKEGLACNDNRLLEQAVQVSAKPDPRIGLRVFLTIAEMTAEARNLGKTKELLAEAEVLAARLSPSDRSEGLAQIAVTMTKVGDASRAKELMREAIKQTDTLEAPDRSINLLEFTVITAQAGDTSGARALLRQALKAAHEVAPKERSNWLAEFAQEMTKVPLSSSDRDLLGEAVKLARELPIDERSDRLGRIALEMAKMALGSSDRDLLGEALKVAGEPPPAETYKGEIALEMAKVGLSSGDRNVLGQALKTAHELPGRERYKWLGEIAKEMANIGFARNDHDLISQAEREAETSTNTSAQGDIAVSMELAGLYNNDRNLLDRALTLSKSIDATGVGQDRERVAEAMAEFGLAHNALGLVDRAKEEAKELHPSRSYSTLAHIAVALAKAGHGNDAKSVLEQARREANEWSESNSDKKGAGKGDRVSLASFPEEFVEVGVMVNDEILIEQGIDMAERIRRGATRRVVKRRLVESLAGSGHLREARKVAETASGSDTADFLAAIVLKSSQARATCP